MGLSIIASKHKRVTLTHQSRNECANAQRCPATDAHRRTSPVGISSTNRRVAPASADYAGVASGSRHSRRTMRESPNAMVLLVLALFSTRMTRTHKEKYSYHTGREVQFEDQPTCNRMSTKRVLLNAMALLETIVTRDTLSIR